MKTFHSLKTGLGLLALVAALFSATSARAQLAYAVDINTSALVGNPAGPFFLDFQANYGSGSPQTIKLTNFSFTGGSLLGVGTSIGAVSGDLLTSLTLSPDSGNFFNEFYQQFSPTVSDIRFTVNLTTAPSGVTPTSFAVAILDNNLFNIPTTGLGDTLLDFNINFRSTNFQTGVSTGPTGGVGAVVIAVPEPSTYGVVAGLALVAAVLWRRRSIASV